MEFLVICFCICCLRVIFGGVDVFIRGLSRFYSFGGGFEVEEEREVSIELGTLIKSG